MWIVIGINIVVLVAAWLSVWLYSRGDTQGASGFLAFYLACFTLLCLGGWILAGVVRWFVA